MSRFNVGDYVVLCTGPDKKWKGRVVYVYRGFRHCDVLFNDVILFIPMRELAHIKTWAIKQFFNEVQ